MNRFEPELALGLMSGTSADGVDVALVRTDGDRVYEYFDSATIDYDASIRSRLIEAARHDIALTEVLEMEHELTQIHIQACQRLLARNPSHADQLRVIGFHGHTIRHDRNRRRTCQLGNASLLAEELGCDVVSDFRRSDMAAGGNGAPLAPLFHQLLFADHPKPVAVLNLGGVGNITYLDSSDVILAGDTGPGCGLLDTLAQRELGTPFDRDGRLAEQGVVHGGVVAAAMQRDFFSLPFPKSADRFEFESLDLGDLEPADRAATLCAITVAGVKSATDQLPRQPTVIWVTGGGSQNPVLMSMLDREVGPVRPIEAGGYRSESLEAECFAWLAIRRLRHLPTSLPETTGCSRPICGGAVTLRAG